MLEFGSCNYLFLMANLLVAHIIRFENGKFRYAGVRLLFAARQMFETLPKFM